MRGWAWIILMAASLAGCQPGTANTTTQTTGAGQTLPVKARLAVDLINAQLEPVNLDTAIEGGRDRMTMEIEIYSLGHRWVWWDTARRTINNGEAWVGQYEDAFYEVSPMDLQPVDVVGTGDGRADLFLRCRTGTCIRMVGSERQASGTEAEVLAALTSPRAVDQRVEVVYFPFKQREQAARVATAMNELLSLYGAERAGG